MDRQQAVIVRVTEGDVVYARNPARENLAAFYISKIVDYHGESARELHLKPGKIVQIAYAVDDIVDSALIEH